MVDRIPVTVIFRGRDLRDGIPHSGPIDGFAPAINSPLAIAPAHYFGRARWVARRAGWVVMHRRLGWTLGSNIWSEQDAWHLLSACDLSFMAWQVVQGDQGITESALIACRVKFRGALEDTDVKPYSPIAEYRHVS